MIALSTFIILHRCDMIKVVQVLLVNISLAFYVQNDGSYVLVYVCDI